MKVEKGNKAEKRIIMEDIDKPGFDKERLQALEQEMRKQAPNFKPPHERKA